MAVDVKGKNAEKVKEYKLRTSAKYIFANSLIIYSIRYLKQKD